jgi:endonuclease-3
MLRQNTVHMQKPMVSIIIDRFGKNPFLILISCLLSLRAKDTATLPVCLKLFEQIKTPQDLLNIPQSELEQRIYTVGFYKKKAHTLHEVSRRLIEQYKGKVPSAVDELLKLPGVGQKTANLVMGEAFDIPAICVDIHVHRISNRLGLVNTKTPEETEVALKKILPKEYWIEWNRLLVMWGQNICVPISPYCSQCAVYELCSRVGVKNYR